MLDCDELLRTMRWTHGLFVLCGGAMFLSACRHCVLLLFSYCSVILFSFFIFAHIHIQNCCACSDFSNIFAL